MVTFRLEFNDNDMSLFFRKHCFTVTPITFKEAVPVYHNREETEEVTSLCVINPFSQKPVPVSVAFEKVILKKAKSILLDDISKLDILESFKTNNNEH